MTTKLSLFAILFSMMTSIVYAQDVFQTPAHNNIDHSLVKDETYKMKWFAVKDTAKIEIGEVSTQISKKEKSNRKEIVWTISGCGNKTGRDF